MNLVDIYMQVKSDVRYIERELERAIKPESRELYQSSTHLLKAGGKRIRPVFVLLAGKFGDYNVQNLSQVAVPLELIHMATLVHDDVVDDANKRRGKDTVRTKWDNRVAMYSGNYILARALSIVTQLSNPEIHQILSKAIVEMCKGEIEQVRDLGNWNQGLRNYLRRIKRKTALLIAISCQLGAVATNASADVVRRMYHFGYNVGMAFQITDDILDFTGTEKQLGKPAGSDLRQGNVTLPALFSAYQGSTKDIFQEWMRTGEINSRIEQAIPLIHQGEGIAYSQALAERYIDRAKQALADLPASPTKKSLMQIADYIGGRKF
ncbi:polyprenyl synthetase family protein [Brevibacillus laterosporus]|uniref:Polyprenyl synthetase family protein n=1 Tax=Brevibacillus laterosporus TaxID=1465 RepID=A0AAP3DH82_BRELA|nr:polyprenyl synthetase family protein [Brevibacillus laterosporus]MCR8981279.1 polyprenyl synthetase family protein [Brevibacillus laterosporus]MCZ0808434.1 polyprenyl synthetase family protein [Brevibacillus laterosporus]MCZ0826849.1 polyprenyl synthetase family protein [Brevibacillus laterosporus]